jgi:hypothetical protein
VKSSKIEGYRLKLEDDCRSICINSRKSGRRWCTSRM